MSLLRTKEEARRPTIGLGSNKARKVSSIYVETLIQVIPFTGGLLFAIYGFTALSGILFFIMEFFSVGRAIRRAFLKPRGLMAASGNQLLGVVYDVLLSIVATTVIVSVFAAAFVLKFIYLAYITIIVTCLVLEVVRNREGAIFVISLESMDIRLRDALPILLCAFWGFVIMFWRLTYVSGPESFGTDQFTHQAIVRIIIENNGSNAILSSYPYIFHAIIASICVMSGIDPYLPFGYGPIIACPIVLVATFIFLKSISRGNLIPLAATIFVPFVNEAGALLGPYYLYPSIYAYAGSFLVMYALRSSWGAGSTSTLILLAYGVIVIAYPSILLVTAFAVFYLWSHGPIYRSSYSDWSANLFRIAGALAFAAIGTYYVIIPSLGLQLDFTDFGIPQLIISDTLSREVALLLIGYSVYQIALLLFGLALLVYTHLAKRGPILRAIFDDRFLVSTILLYLMVYFMPFEYGYRVEMFIRPFMILCMFLGLTIAANSFSNHSEERGKRRSRDSASPSALLVVFLIVLISAVPTIQRIDTTLRYEPHNPHIDELNAANWLRGIIEENHYILTDPASGLILRAFLARNCSTSFIMSERTRSPVGNLELYGNVFGFLNASSGEEIASYNLIRETTGEVTYILVSPRTTAFLANERAGRNGIYSIYTTYLWNDDPAWDKFNQAQYQLVNQFGELRILSLVL